MSERPQPRDSRVRRAMLHLRRAVHVMRRGELARRWAKWREETQRSDKP